MLLLFLRDSGRPSKPPHPTPAELEKTEPVERPGSSSLPPTELSVEIIPEKLLSRNFQSPWQSLEEFGCGSQMQLDRLCRARAGEGPLDVL